MGFSSETLSQPIEGFASSLEIFAASLFETFDGELSTTFDNPYVFVAYWEILSLNWIFRHKIHSFLTWCFFADLNQLLFFLLYY